MPHESPPGVRLPDRIDIVLFSILGWTIAALLGLVSAWVVRSFGFANMAAAQITTGVFGFGGGWFHALLLQKTGAHLSWRHRILLSTVWALVCVAGVTPLFFVMGTALKIGILTFCSFALFGALGGTVTALAMRPFFPDDNRSRKVLSSAVIWAFSLGFAAMGGGVLGEGLQPFLHPAAAWSAAMGFLVLTVGCGGGFSVIHFRSGEKKEMGKGTIEYETGPRPFQAPKGNRLYIGTLILLCLPFYLNDFANIYVTDWRIWLWIDNTSVKLFPFLVMLWLISSKRMQPAAFGLAPQKAISFLAVFLTGTLTVLLILQNGHLVLNWLPDSPHLGKMPEIKSDLWRLTDLTAGLFMVGFFEELVFRGYLYTFISRYTRRSWLIVTISAVAFGFIHWSAGLHMVMLAAAAGAVFMVLYLQTFSLPAIMLAHFAVDFLDTADFIPKYLFRVF